MAITEKRGEVVNFTKPYYFNAARFVARKDLELKSAMPDDLKGRVIGTQSGTGEAKLLARHFKGAKLKRYPKLDDALLDLETGRVDTVLASQFVLGAWLQKDSGNCCEFVGETFVEDENNGTGIAVRKSDTELLNNLNKAIDEIVADGTYTKIREKYFSFGIMTPPAKASALFGK